jgi:predicted lipoprotein with Yx(FWY)xxD motif
MHSTARLATMLSRRRIRKAAALVGLTAIAAVTALPGGVASASAKSSGTVVAAVNGEFGTMLVAGTGPAAGTALYSITSDYRGHIGCTTKVVSFFGGKTACTGPTDEPTSEWPALLTSGAPVAGSGVNQSLLGEVKIKGLGEQVTYNGHPLYLFDQVPGLITGENWDESTVPPWHGVWYLVDAAGSFLPRTALLGTVTIKHESVLAAYMTVGGGSVLFPVYTYSGGANCKSTCADEFPPLISQGRPGTTGGASGKLGSLKRPDGTEQVTYNGRPLYLYSNEAFSVGPTGVAAEGNGNGVRAPAPYMGAFRLVAPGA